MKVGVYSTVLQKLILYHRHLLALGYQRDVSSDVMSFERKTDLSTDEWKYSTVMVTHYTCYALFIFFFYFNRSNSV